MTLEEAAKKLVEAAKVFEWETSEAMNEMKRPDWEHNEVQCDFCEAGLALQMARADVEDILEQGSIV